MTRNTKQSRAGGNTHDALENPFHYSHSVLPLDPMRSKCESAAVLSSNTITGKGKDKELQQSETDSFGNCFMNIELNGVLFIFILS